MAHPADRPAPSLTRRLLLSLLPALTLLALVGAVVDYWQVRQLADDAYDQALGNAAMGLAVQIEADRDNDTPQHMAELAAQVARQRPGGGLRFVVLADDGHVVAGDPRIATLMRPGADSNPAFQDARLDGHSVRVARYRHVGEQGRADIVVAEGLHQRRAAAQAATRAAAWANAAMVLAVLLVVTLGVRRGLRPLHRLGHQAASQDVDDLRPLDAPDAPREVQPLVAGLNRLIGRVRVANQAQHAFLSASAHQLRTPLAGLQAQADVLLSVSAGTPLQPRVAALRASVQRLTHVTHQLLAMARTEASRNTETQAEARERIDLVELLQELAGEHLDAAIERGIDLGLETAPAQVTGLKWMLREMVGNLLDNALRHAPRDTPLTLRCGQRDRAAFIEVEDAGPGIPDTERERVFEPFVRLSDTIGHGSGLGLAIVREVAARHAAQVQLLDRPDGPGTLARVSFPPEGKPR